MASFVQSTLEIPSVKKGSLSRRNKAAQSDLDSRRLGRASSMGVHPFSVDSRTSGALRAYWRFYAARKDAIWRDVRRAVAHLAELRPDGAQTKLGAIYDEVQLLQRNAIVDDQWEPFLAYLATRGEQLAGAEVTYAAWFELVMAFRDAVREHARVALQEDIEGNLGAATEVSDGLNALIDLVVQRVTDAYVKTKELRAASSEARYRAIFERSPAPMWIHDRQSLRFVAVNQAAIDHYGYTSDEFIGLTIADVVVPDDPISHVTRSDQVAHREWRHRRKNGTIVAVEIRTSDLTIDGHPATLVHVNDVTERALVERTLASMEDQFRHAQKMETLGALASGVAHDFNNLLMVIGASAELIEEGTDLVGAHLAEVLDIRRAAERGTALTRQLLKMSRHDVASPRLIDLGEVVGTFVPILRRLVGSRVTVEHRLSTLPTVLADPIQVEQILMNLAVNARDAMPDGGRLFIETGTFRFDIEQAAARGLKPGSYVSLDVSDSGIGMDGETQRKIFEPFFTTKVTGEGTGLGLAIVHGIVTQAGGVISVFSDLGHGTTFRVYFPINDRNIALTEPTEVSSAPRVLPPVTVLVVENEDSVRHIVSRVLKVAGCRVLEVESADAARRACVAHDGDLEVALIDLALPDGRGDLLAHELRALRPSLATLLMSGYPAAAIGIAEETPLVVLAKPFSAGELRLAISKTLGVAPQTRSPTASRPRVLLAEDDVDFRRSLARYLTKRDLEIVEVDSGSAAISALGEQKFDVVLSDVHMPGMDGLELLRGVRRIDLDVPVILMSGEPDVATAAAALEYGAFRYLTKPFELGDVGKLLVHAIRARRLARLRRDAMSVAGARAGAVDRAGLEVRFERALDLLWMAFQPIVDARTGRSYGTEALVRTDEPSMPTPAQLLDAATQLDRLPQLGRRVRELSAAGAASFPDATVLFVNLHPSDLADVELISATAPLTRIASRVVLEVTEREALDRSLQLSPRIGRLRELGFRLAVDDIGAGYSGLTSFADLTPEIVKIDMSLVRDVHHNLVRQRTIRSLCALCHEGGALVVGEGVESEGERDCLIELGCDLLQGYLIARPSRLA